ncbi:hypothetical protein DGWBC_0567 [Dehalogenimonas sp. WBC-2]|nr:hypothetical protein DGWBC_0567 [Dehalogenimonas sp. WBC-2]
MLKWFVNTLAVVSLLAGWLFSFPSPAAATGVDHVALCNLEGHAGESLTVAVTLQGNEAETRDGFWYAYYKQTDGDDARMDITSWITFEPEEYVITKDQSITFNIRVNIPADAAPGLWGATAATAGQSGHSAERRSYVVFKDTPSGGNVYSGLLIPVSVVVLEDAAATLPPDQDQPGSSSNFFSDNLLVIVLALVILVLLGVILKLRGAGSSR